MLQKELIGLQWLRAMAALMVVMAHNHDFLLKHGMEFYDGWIGGIGVDIFFIISGYVMFGLMDGLPQGRREAYMFAAKRIGRIVPIYWLVILSVILFWQITGNDLSGGMNHYFRTSRVVKNLLFLDANPIVGVGWTLAYEMFFYLLSGVAILAITRNSTRLLAISLTLAALVLVGIVAEYTGRIVGNPLILEFAAGGLIWFLLNKFGDRLPPPIGITTALAGLAGMVMLYGHHDYNHGHPYWFAASFLFVFGIMMAEPYFMRMRWRGPVALGDASYFLYLVHFYVIITVTGLLFDVFHVTPGLAPALFATIMIMAITCTLSLLGHVYLERPLSRYVTGHLLRLLRWTARGRSDNRQAGQPLPL